MTKSPACMHFLPQLSPFVDGELKPPEREAFERHLAACKDCTARVADFRAEAGLVRVGLDMLADDVDFKDFSNRVMARITPARMPLLEGWRIAAAELFTYHRGPLMGGFAAAATALVLMLGVV